jgi:hypothetical protein
MHDYGELVSLLPYLKSLFKERIALAVNEGLKGLKQKAGDIAEKTVDSMASGVLDEIMLERSSGALYKAAHMAALRMEMERVKNNAIETCIEEASLIMQAFDKVIHDAALQATEEVIREAAKGKVS